MIRFRIILAVKYPEYNGFTMKWEIWVQWLRETSIN